MSALKQQLRIACLFPGQGAQYPAMARDFVDNFSIARQTFEEADDVLNEKFSKCILNGSKEELLLTRNSQLAIYIVGISLFRVVKELFPFQPFVCSGLSLGEYTALTAAGWLTFEDALPLVRSRADFMTKACESTNGTMAVVMGLEAQDVDHVVESVNLPSDVWVANYNCPGQIVIAGTLKGVEAASHALKAAGAKRVLSLDVQGAFHSGLMNSAGIALAPYIQAAKFNQSQTRLVMNVPGHFVDSSDAVHQHLIDQVTHSVRWQQGVEAIDKQGVDVYIEFGPGKTLSGMNKRMQLKAQTLSVDKVDDLACLRTFFNDN